MRSYFNRTVGIILFLAFLVGVFTVGFFFADIPGRRLVFPAQIRWLTMIVLVLVFFGILGRQIRGRWVGILIDNRNKISLSRFQLAVWTMLIMSAFMTIGLARSRAGYLDVLTPEMAAECEAQIREAQEDTEEGRVIAEQLIDETCVTQRLQIVFPDEVIAALGISTASLAGSSLIKRNKKDSDQTRGVIITIQERERDLFVLAEAEKDKLATIEVELAELEEEKFRFEIQRAEAAENVALAQTEEEKAEAQAVLNAVEAEARNVANRATLLELERRSQTRLAQIAEDNARDFSEGQKNSVGLQHRNAHVDDASWADMFRGEEITNFDSIEIAKVQMFFFTIAVVFTYAALIWTSLQDSAALRNPLGFELPAFTASLNYLLLVSHAGYLTQKYSTGS